MEIEWLLRVVVAGLCGAWIGYERKNRMKEAGIKTHFIVGIGAALMMIISKYGFRDQIGWENLSLDPSRIAAQVVSGVGFLGAGMIFLQKMTVKGLTTAAGVWATAGLGMAIGSGLYVIGIGATLIILAAQKVLHGGWRWFRSPKTEQFSLRLGDEPGALSELLALLKAQGIALLAFQAEQGGAGELSLELTVKLPPGYGVADWLAAVSEAPYIRSADTN
ncbi:MgtC/SapB family protein [Cohnella nanjingensis]|uniref:MgtC/SapB family protein n=1 Tax=Cohnella nanjingensis TaxID=1387779 RepID=A0A7X0RXQ9_9BACL|nr:MgtC/SapB family protein [Cohnella nanjingensis]MBB6675500.1 MgtC/SapB family protein [Cohnella nanjingensis]